MKYNNLVLVLLCWISGYAQESQILEYDAGIIHYKVFGTGKPILIVNGGPGMNCEGFATLAQEIADRGFQTIIYDQRGTGKSKLNQVDSTTISMNLMVEDMEHLRKHLKIKKWTLFGQSFGGFLATQYAHTYPKQVDKIIFSAAAGVNLDFMNDIGQRLRINLTESERDSLDFYTKKLDLDENNKEIIAKRAPFLASAYVFQKQYIPILAKRMTQVDYNINELVFKDLIKSKFHFEKQFENFKKPVLIFQGKNDVISIETANSIHETFSNSKLVLLENCGHYAWLDQHTVFFDELISFLKTKK